jgi:hypothetical protein
VLLLASCASNPIATVHTITVHTPVIIAVPQAYTQPIAVPALKADPVTNADLAHYILILRQALADANARLEAIAGLHK